MEKDYTGKEKHNVMSKGCIERVNCIKLLSDILDKEATVQEEEFFFKHVSECMSCYQLYQLEASIKNVVIKKIEKKPVPAYLADSIRDKIKNL